MKQVEVTILGQSYLLACPEDGQEALLKAVATVDREMSAIRDAGKVRARERMAVLTALNLAYRLANREDEAAGTRPASSAAGGSRSEAGSAASSADRPEAPLGHEDPQGQIDIDGLINRLDQVLAEDGRLL